VCLARVRPGGRHDGHRHRSIITFGIVSTVEPTNRPHTRVGRVRAPGDHLFAHQQPRVLQSTHRSFKLVLAQAGVARERAHRLVSNSPLLATMNERPLPQRPTDAEQPTQPCTFKCPVPGDLSANLRAGRFTRALRAHLTARRSNMLTTSHGIDNQLTVPRGTDRISAGSSPRGGPPKIRIGPTRSGSSGARSISRARTN